MNIENENNKESYILKETKEALKNVKEENPLTYCITNSVTVNDCANAVLAIGGSPIMAYNEEEVEERGNDNLFPLITGGSILSDIKNSSRGSFDLGSRGRKESEKSNCINISIGDIVVNNVNCLFIQPQK